jgi:Rrf2 family protein
VKLSKRCEYALRVLLDLAMAESMGESLVPLTVLAEAQRIPGAFLEQILLSLRQGGFLRATRGKYGGYTLAQPSAELRIGDIVRFLEGPLAPSACASHSAYQPCSCPDEKHCGIRRLMIDARDALSRVWDGITLCEMADRTIAGLHSEGLVPPVVALMRSPEMRHRVKRSGTDVDYMI